MREGAGVRCRTPAPSYSPGKGPLTAVSTCLLPADRADRPSGTVAAPGADEAREEDEAADVRPPARAELFALVKGGAEQTSGGQSWSWHGADAPRPRDVDHRCGRHGDDRTARPDSDNRATERPLDGGTAATKTTDQRSSKKVLHEEQEKPAGRPVPDRRGPARLRVGRHRERGAVAAGLDDLVRAERAKDHKDDPDQPAHHNDEVAES